MQSIFAVVCVFNRLELTQRFLASFRQVQYPNKHLVICDDGSTDGTTEFLKQQPDVIVVQGNGNLWWSGGTNAAIRKALELGADYVLTVNNDAVIAADCLDHLYQTAVRRPRSIIAASILQLQNPKLVWCLGATYINHHGVLYICDCQGASLNLLERLASPLLEIDVMPGNGVLYPASVFAEIGFFDEAWTPHYHGDTLFVARGARAGYARRTVLAAHVTNDMTPPRPNNRDPLAHLGAPDFLPAVYKAIEERQDAQTALDAIGNLCHLHDSPALASVKDVWQPIPTLPGSINFDPTFGHHLPNGSFAFIGYIPSLGVTVEQRYDGQCYHHHISGTGILSLVLKIQQPCRFRIFFQLPPEVSCQHRHFEFLAPYLKRGILHHEGQDLLWFDVSASRVGFLQLPITLWSLNTPWSACLIISENNLHPDLLF